MRFNNEVKLTVLFFILIFPFGYLGSNSVFKAIPFFIFTIFCLFVFFENKFLRIVLSPHKIITAEILILSWIFFNMLRNNNPDSKVINSLFKILTISVFIFLFSKIKFSSSVSLEKSFFYSIVGSFLIFSFISFGAKKFGVFTGEDVNLDLGNAIILSFFGVDLNRSNFPLTGGINSYSSLLGVLVVICFLYAIYFPKLRTISVFAGVVFFWQLLVLDSRGPIIFAILTVISTVLLTRFRKVNLLSNIIPFVSIAGPFLFVLGLQLFIIFFNFDEMLRNSTEAYTGNSRLVIWLISLDEFIDFKLQHLIGYGEFGHFASGKSLLWAGNFAAYENNDAMHPHSSMLVLLYDYGYIGLILYFNFLIKLLRKVKKISMTSVTKLDIVFYGIFLYIGLIGSSESFIGFYYSNVFNFILIVVLFVMKSSFFYNNLITGRNVKKRGD